MLPVREVGGKTNVDGGAARASARDGWAASAGKYFVHAHRVHEADATAAIQALRHVLEGWAQAACLELDPDYWSAVCQGQRATPEDLLRRLANHVDRRFIQTARAIQQRGNYFSHNQGEYKPATPREAVASLFDAAHLLDHLHREVLRSPPSQELERVLSDVERPSRSSTAQVAPVVAGPPPQRDAVSLRNKLLVAGGLIGATLVAVVVVLVTRPPAASATAEPSSSAPKSGQSAPSSTAARPHESTRADQARIRLGGYLTALRSGNVQAIVEFHAIPTQRLFLITNADEERLTWAYGKAGNPAAPAADALDRCTVVSESPVAFLCPTEPKQQCFVFDDNLKLAARYDYQGRYGQPTTCPP